MDTGSRTVVEMSWSWNRAYAATADTRGVLQALERVSTKTTTAVNIAFHRMVLGPAASWNFLDGERGGETAPL